MAAMICAWVNKKSSQFEGGQIPGAPGIPAFRFWERSPHHIPVLIAVPHAGRVYPRGLLRGMRYPEASGIKLEDRHVDKIARMVADQTGASLLIAQAARALIDLNRAPDDVDWEMIERSARPTRSLPTASARVRGGLGLVPRRLHGLGELWRGPISGHDLTQRISHVHEPYHSQLSEMLRKLKSQWGGALLIDLHSMPPLNAHADQPSAQFVIGDRYGMTSDGALVRSAFLQLADDARPAAYNRPYAGGYVLERHANPAAGIFAMQVEIDRSCYLDERMLEPGAGLEGVAGVISRMVTKLSDEMIALCQSRRTCGTHLAAE